MFRFTDTNIVVSMPQSLVDPNMGILCYFAKTNVNPNASWWNNVALGNFHVGQHCFGFALGMLILCCLSTFSRSWVCVDNQCEGFFW